MAEKNSLVPCALILRVFASVPSQARTRGLEVWSAGADRWRPETQIFREKKNGIRVDEDMGQGPREKEREREGGRERV